ncbi:MAG TPA: universal stress protein [Thermoanaerobaculia bacterium]|nr:universal stress protein [Thermoanaerobaculia bacterium]
MAGRILRFAQLAQVRYAGDAPLLPRERIGEADRERRIDVPIVCGTDLSESSRAACEVAGALARRAGTGLVVVHAVKEEADAGDRVAGELEKVTAAIGSAGTEVAARIVVGTPETVIPRVAAEIGADLIVIAATSRPGVRWSLGSSSDRIVSTTSVPVLVVRNGSAVAEWAGGARTLGVAVATDLSPISDDAVAWASSLTRFGPCRFVLIHLSLPPDAYHRLGIEGPMLLDQSHPAVARSVRRHVEATGDILRRSGPSEIVVEPGSGNAAADLSRLARAAEADLLVVGHLPNRIWRVWEGSVARSAIRSAEISVACIPRTEGGSAKCDALKIERVIAATDLSPAGNAAVAQALSLLPDKGEITILHVVEDAELDEPERARIIEGLERLAESCGYRERDVSVKFELLESEEPAGAICAAAAEADADLICIASRGRSMLPRVLLGSVAQELLLLCRIPVLIVPPPTSGE